ncbi:E3 ubiquitin-protein ligase ptr1 [Astathelohania contejeani]|uniref:E3 ubiquitin-protein ligase ptr1 n=1 Tax=Astathelohania contejeani TaxID=164912 RepID=A0ABQ7HZQ5_9MICR|nr:E3 ubiquitin-protein ligase ptr1 [Thelohania contejeani]
MLMNLYMYFFNRATAYSIDTPHYLSIYSVDDDKTKLEMYCEKEKEIFNNIIKKYCNNKVYKYLKNQQKLKMTKDDMKYICDIIHNIIKLDINFRSEYLSIVNLFGDNIFYLIFSNDEDFLIKLDNLLLELIDKMSFYLLNNQSSIKFYEYDEKYLRMLKNSIDECINKIQSAIAEEGSFYIAKPCKIGIRAKTNIYITWSIYYFLLINQEVNLDKELITKYLFILAANSKYSERHFTLLLLLDTLITNEGLSKKILKKLNIDSLIYKLMCYEGINKEFIRVLISIYKNVYGSNKGCDVWELMYILNVFYNDISSRKILLNLFNLENEISFVKFFIDKIDSNEMLCNYDFSSMNFFITIFNFNVSEIDDLILCIYNSIISKSFKMMKNYMNCYKTNPKCEQDNYVLALKVLLEFLNINKENQNIELSSEVLNNRYYFTSEGIFLNNSDVYISLSSKLNVENIKYTNLITAYINITMKHILKDLGFGVDLFKICMKSDDAYFISFFYSVLFMLNYNCKSKSYLIEVPLNAIHKFKEFIVDNKIIIQKDNIFLKNANDYINKTLECFDDIASLQHYYHIKNISSDKIYIQLFKNDDFVEITMNKFFKEMKSNGNKFPRKRLSIIIYGIDSDHYAEIIWLGKLLDEIFSTKRLLFINCNDNFKNVYAPFLHDSISIEIKDQYKFVGHLIGYVLRTGNLFFNFFPNFLYNKLIYHDYGTDELEAEINWVHDLVMNLPESLDNDYECRTIPCVNSNDQINRKYDKIELLFENYEYQIYNKQILLKEIKRKLDFQINYIRLGILQMVDHYAFRTIKSGNELMKLISCDTYEITVEQWKRFTRIVPVRFENKSIIKAFWKYISKLNQENRQKLLQKWSGLRIFPAVSVFRYNIFCYQLNICIIDKEKNACFSQKEKKLYLPMCKTYERLSRIMDDIINE